MKMPVHLSGTIYDDPLSSVNLHPLWYFGAILMYVQKNKLNFNKIQYFSLRFRLYDSEPEQHTYNDMIL